MSGLEAMPPVPKVEHSEEEEFDESSNEADDPSLTQEPAQVQKRKGGRKPIYATSEERKQRNRQAQAAFRERRTEYIKQLETTIKHHEEQLQSLQQSHRSAADECLMLRYKNSLLERILLEKGVDVQAELKMKTDSTHATPHPPASAPGGPSAVQRAVMNRQGQPRRSNCGPAPKPLRPQQISSHPPPRLQPTPPSTTRSPTSGSSPHGSSKTIPRSSSGDGINMQKHRQLPLEPRQQGHQPPPTLSIPPGVSGILTMSPSSAGGSKGSDLGTASTQNFYPSPFQAHIEQLEQEYDAHADMLDDENPSDASLGPGSAFPQHSQQYNQHPMAPDPQMSMSMQSQPLLQPMQPMQPMQQQPPTTQPVDPNNPAYGMIHSTGFDPYDPSLDADPFGLTASMHFPTQFTFQESSMRR